MTHLSISAEKNDASFVSKGAVLVGVVSWGLNCGGIYPGVYSKVAHSRDWIDEAIKESWSLRKSRSLSKNEDPALLRNAEGQRMATLPRIKRRKGNEVTQFDSAKCSSYLTGEYKKQTKLTTKPASDNF